MAKLLVIERSGNHEQSFVTTLERKGFEVTVAHTGKSAIKVAKKEKPSLVVLDAASLGTSGNRICGQLNVNLNGVPVIHIRSAEHAVDDEKAGPGDISLDMPFTGRKLINRVERLLPDVSDRVISGGPVQLDLDRRIVRAHGKSKRLTPKCTHLLEILLENSGETLDRKLLMKKIWKTDYVGDTRTLDVHVRWLREAVERRPADPQHIVTVRGVGYRFESEPDMDGP